MPGTIPATSQLDRLISMTAINVLAGSRAMRDRLKLFNVCMGSSIGSQRTMDAISTPPAHSIFHIQNAPKQQSDAWTFLLFPGPGSSPCDTIRYLDAGATMKRREFVAILGSAAPLNACSIPRSHGVRRNKKKRRMTRLGSKSVFAVMSAA